MHALGRRGHGRPGRRAAAGGPAPPTGSTSSSRSRCRPTAAWPHPPVTVGLTATDVPGGELAGGARRAAGGRLEAGAAAGNAVLRRHRERPGPRAVRSASGGQPGGHRRPGGGQAVPGLVRAPTENGGTRGADAAADRPGAAALRRGAGRAGRAGGVPGRGAGRGGARRPPAPALPAYDATDLPLVTVDPPGSRDLDQALHLAARPGGGFRVSYAIADVAAFVRPGGAVDAEARQRTQTLYSPDLRTPLHPPVLGEGAASLLPDQVRPAVLWRIDLDAGRRGRRGRRAAGAGAQPGPAGLPGRCRPRWTRAPRRSRWRCCRGSASCGPRWPGPGTPPSWRCPSRRCVPAEGGGWTVRVPPAAAGRAGGTRRSRCSPAPARRRLMLDGGVGLLRTLPAPRPEDVARAAPARRRRSGSTGRPAAEPGDVISALDGATPGQAAFLEHAAVLLRGAAYTPLDGAPPADPLHHGVGAAVRARHRADPAAGRPVRQRGLRGARAPARRCRTGSGPRCRSCRR